MESVCESRKKSDDLSLHQTLAPGLLVAGLWLRRLRILVCMWIIPILCLLPHHRQPRPSLPALSPSFSGSCFLCAVMCPSARVRIRMF